MARGKWVGPFDSQGFTLGYSRDRPIRGSSHSVYKANVNRYKMHKNHDKKPKDSTIRIEKWTGWTDPSLRGLGRFHPELTHGEQDAGHNAKRQTDPQ